MENCNNEAIIINSKIKSIKPKLSFIKGALSIFKIHIYLGNGQTRTGTGFFLKIKSKYSDESYQYYLITNEHIILQDLLKNEQIKFIIYYHFEEMCKEFIINTSESFIKEYKTSEDLDITIIQIKKDEIPWQYFIEPDYEFFNNINYYINAKIIIHQFPLGLEQAYSKGNIVKIDKNNIFYTNSTENGSSGSPIMLIDSEKVIGIHRGNFNIKMNCGILLNIIINDEERIKKCNFYKEKNKNLNYYYYYNAITVEKTFNGRKYVKDNYNISLDNRNDIFFFNIENIENKKLFQCNINIDDFYDIIIRR